MAEDAWIRSEREYFSQSEHEKLEITEKKLNKILEMYNKRLQKSLLDESPFVAEDLQLTLLQSRIDTIKGKYNKQEKGEDAARN